MCRNKIENNAVQCATNGLWNMQKPPRFISSAPLENIE